MNTNPSFSEAILLANEFFKKNIKIETKLEISSSYCYYNLWSLFTPNVNKDDLFDKTWSVRILTGYNQERLILEVNLRLLIHFAFT